MHICFPINLKGNFFSNLNFARPVKFETIFKLSWGGVVVKALRYQSQGPGVFPRWCHWGFFCGIRQFDVLEIDSASKNEYQDTPGGKDGRCVMLTNYHFQVLMSRNLEALTSQNHLGPIGL
jgi:hypothetical protein